MSCHLNSPLPFTVYRLMTNDTNQSLTIQQSVQSYFNDPDFIPTEWLVVTWSNVGYYDAQNDKVYTLKVQKS